jgi:hypothetical protein
MSGVVQVVDEVVGHSVPRPRRKGPRLTVVEETVSAAEIIRLRVGEEWARDMRDMTEPFADRAALIAWLHRGGAEHPATRAAAEKAALRALESNQILFFWNDTQIEDPRQRLHLRAENEALFVRLLPLTGG